MIKDNIHKIISEVEFVLSKVDQKQISKFIDAIYSSNKIVLCGAGRVGMATRAFSMRLGHLGLNSYFLGDSTVPNIGNKDLLIVSSGSGETQTIYDVALIAKKHNSRIALITGNPNSRIGTLADIIIEVDAPSKTKEIKGFKSVQPMTSLNEQCLFLLFDAIVLEIMELKKQTHDLMWERHSVLE